MPRIACLWVPDLPLCAAVRAEPRLADAALAVVQPGNLGGRAHVLCRTPRAEGVSPGQTLAEARAICPALEHRQASAERERAAAQAAIEAAAAVSPRFEEAAPGRELPHLRAADLVEVRRHDDRRDSRSLHLTRQHGHVPTEGMSPSGPPLPAHSKAFPAHADQWPDLLCGQQPRG